MGRTCTIKCDGGCGEEHSAITHSSVWGRLHRACGWKKGPKIGGAVTYFCPKEACAEKMRELGGGEKS